MFPKQTRFTRRSFVVLSKQVLQGLIQTKCQIVTNWSITKLHAFLSASRRLAAAAAAPTASSSNSGGNSSSSYINTSAPYCCTYPPPPLLRVDLQRFELFNHCTMFRAVEKRDPSFHMCLSNTYVHTYIYIYDIYLCINVTHLFTSTITSKDTYVYLCMYISTYKCDLLSLIFSRLYLNVHKYTYIGTYMV